MRVRIYLSIPLLILLFAAAASAAAAEPLLPAQLGAWQQKEWQQVNAGELERVAGPQAALLREYGCQRAEQATYRRGSAEWRIAVYEMPDRSSAYGAFTLLRTGGTELALGEGGARIPNELVFYQSNLFARVAGAVGSAELAPLARRLREQAGPQASLPVLPSYLSRESFVAGSDRYLLGPLAMAEVAPLAAGDWAGFAYGGEAEAARYRVAGSEATLLLLSYPTPQIAVDRLRDFERLFNVNGTGDPLRRLVYVRRIGTLVVLVAGVDSGQAAARLLGGVNYARELSSAEPSVARQQPGYTETIVNIVLGTGVLLLFALASGILFGLVRLVIKRLLPGRVFDRPEDSEIIHLDLRSRP